jgi:hypothetical protein
VTDDFWWDPFDWLTLDGPTCAGALGGKWMTEAEELSILVRTADVKQAGTSANVYLDVYGSAGVARFIHLPDDDPKDFERGQEDGFSVRTHDLGTIKKICIYHDNGGKGAEWALDYVHVIPDWADDRMFQFGKYGKGYQWLANNKDPKRRWACRPTDSWPGNVWRPV